MNSDGTFVPGCVYVYVSSQPGGNWQGADSSHCD